MHLTPGQSKVRAKIRNKTGNKMILRLIEHHSYDERTLYFMLNQLPDVGRPGYVPPEGRWG